MEIYTHNHAAFLFYVDYLYTYSDLLFLQRFAYEHNSTICFLLFLAFFIREYCLTESHIPNSVFLPNGHWYIKFWVTDKTFYLQGSTIPCLCSPTSMISEFSSFLALQDFPYFLVSLTHRFESVLLWQRALTLPLSTIMMEVEVPFCGFNYDQDPGLTPSSYLYLPFVSLNNSYSSFKTQLRNSLILKPWNGLLIHLKPWAPEVWRMNCIHSFISSFWELVTSSFMLFL